MYEKLGESDRKLASFSCNAMDIVLAKSINSLNTQGRLAGFAA